MGFYDPFLLSMIHQFRQIRTRHLHPTLTHGDGLVELILFITFWVIFSFLFILAIEPNSCNEASKNCAEEVNVKNKHKKKDR